jgi:hypothetical protein
VTSIQSLLYAAASDITIERVRALVKQVGAESPTIEYKEQMTDTIARGIAALGNTYGGLLLVGVTDDRIVRGVKEKTIESVADHCAAKIEPPWVPEIIPVPLGQGSGCTPWSCGWYPAITLGRCWSTGSRMYGTRTLLIPRTGSGSGTCSPSPRLRAKKTSGTFTPRPAAWR